MGERSLDGWTDRRTDGHRMPGEQIFFGPERSFCVQTFVRRSQGNVWGFCAAEFMGKQGPHISCKKPTICEFIISRHQNSLKVRGIRVKLKMTQLPEKG